MSKVVGDVISDHFCLKKFSQKNTQKGGRVKKCKFLPLEQTQPNFVLIIYRPPSRRPPKAGLAASSK